MEFPKLSNTEYNKNLKDKFSLNEQIEQFYSKPESDEELFRRVGIIRNIPENINTPKVLLKLGKPDKADKFVHMRDEDGRDYVIALPITKRAYHRDIANFCRKLYHKNLKVLGGGWIENKDGKLVIFGQSQDFGEADKIVVRDILKQTFPDVEIEAKELANINKKYTEALNRIETEVGKDLYADVVQRKGIRMGFDMAMPPQSVEGSDNKIATMIYKSENGRSFGIDTLFLGYTDKDRALHTKEVAQTRWSVFIKKAEVNDGILTLEFESDGQVHTISQPIDSLEKIEMFSDLGEHEKQVLQILKDYQFAYHSEDYEILHAS